MPKIAILIATHNGERWLNEQLQSILNQKDAEVTLFISDDISSDSTLSIIHSVSQDNNNIFLMPENASLGSAARNFFRLIKEVNLDQFAYVALSDQDDIWLSDKLKRAVEKIQNQNLEGYSSNINAFWPDKRTKLIDKAQPQKKYDYMFESAGPGCTFVLTQKLALALKKTLKEHEENLQSIALHDWFIYAFARSRGYKWFIDPIPTLNYRQHANNVIGANTGLKAIRARLSKLNQGWYFRQILLIAKELGYDHLLPIKKIMRLNVWDRCYLAILSFQYRRRLRDRFAFAFFILFIAKKS